MLGFVSDDIPWYAISNLELSQLYKVLRKDLGLPSDSTHCNIGHREYALTVDVIRKQFVSQIKVSVAFDGHQRTKLP
jgi:hypothetical protein